MAEMTKQEFKRVCEGMSRQQLIALLTEVETAVNKVSPISWDYVLLAQKKRETEASLKESSHTLKVLKIVILIFGVGGLLFLITSGRTDGISGFFRKLIGGFGLLCAVITFLIRLFTKATEKKETAVLKELEPQLLEAKQKLEQVKADNINHLIVRQWICPEETYDPKYMRVFVRYFENGRADNLKEAYALFDEMLHREKMENYAHDQVRAAQAAEAASYAAVDAANRAAATANQAKSSADWAAYWTRFKD